MKGSLKYLTVMAAALGLTLCFTASSARFAYAEDLDSPTDVATEPDSLPDFNGCWASVSAYGALKDKHYGKGYGWINIDQSGSEIVASDVEYQFSFFWYHKAKGAYAYGVVSGTVTSKGFTATSSLGGSCEMEFAGRLGTKDNIQGTYKAKSCKSTHFSAEGTFNLPFNTSGGCDYLYE